MTTQITHIKMMKKKILAFPLVILLSFVYLFIAAPLTEAYPEGILGHHGAEGATCTRCHNGGTAPEMGLSGGRDVVSGETILYTLVITSGAPDIQQYAGFNLVIASPDGNSYAAGLTPLDSSTKTEYAELTHTAPQANDVDGVARFAFEWIVPAETGAYSFYFAANSANGDGRTSGDMSARAIETITVSADPAAPLAVQMRQAETAVYTHTLFLLTCFLMTLTAITLARKTIDGRAIMVV